MTVRHPGGLKNLLDKTLLSELEQLGDWIRGDADAQESKGSGGIPFFASEAIS